jgi:hypothetical protein
VERSGASATEEVKGFNRIGGVECRLEAGGGCAKPPTLLRNEGWGHPALFVDGEVDARDCGRDGEKRWAASGFLRWLVHREMSDSVEHQDSGYRS